MKESIRKQLTMKEDIYAPGAAKSPPDTDEAQRRLEQAEHRLQRAENRKAYIKNSKRKLRDHRLVTRGVAMEYFFPEIIPLTEREFFELTEELSGMSPVQTEVQIAVASHHDAGLDEQKEAS